MTNNEDYVENIGYEEEEVLLPIGINLKCAKCEMGYLEVVEPNVDNPPAVSYTLDIYPLPKPKYEHRCTNEECDNHAFFEDIYPRITYDNIENYLKSIS